MSVDDIELLILLELNHSLVDVELFAVNRLDHTTQVPDCILLLGRFVEPRSENDLITSENTFLCFWSIVSLSKKIKGLLSVCTDVESLENTTGAVNRKHISLMIPLHACGLLLSCLEAE